MFVPLSIFRDIAISNANVKKPTKATNCKGLELKYLNKDSQKDKPMPLKAKCPLIQTAQLKIVLMQH